MILRLRQFFILCYGSILFAAQFAAHADILNDSPKDTLSLIGNNNVLSENINNGAQNNLVKLFTTPPPSTKPSIYWYWNKDNISKEVITRDMEAMARAEIGEVIINNVDSNGTPSSILFKGWWDLAAHAVREGSRLDINVNFYSCPGWSEDEGLTVKPEKSSRYLTYIETYVYGPSKFTAKLATPPPAAYFQDVATIAFPAPEGDLDTIALHSPRVSITATRSLGADDSQSQYNTPIVSTGTDIGNTLLSAWPRICSATPLVKKLIIDVMVDDLFTARSLTISLRKKYTSLDIEAHASDSRGSFTKIKGFNIEHNDAIPQIRPQDGSYTPSAGIQNITISIPETTSKHFRFIVDPKGIDLKDIEVLGIVDIHVSAASRINRFEQKQFSAIYERESTNWQSYLWDPQPEPDTPNTIIKSPEKIINLSRNMENGVLSWEVPPGKWVVLRVGSLPVHMHQLPEVPDGTGLEIDRLDQYAVRAHDRAFVQEILNRVPVEDRKSFKRLIPNEKNLGESNWSKSEGMGGVLDGYNLIRWLPVLTGRMIASAGESNRVLWQGRCVIKNKIEQDYKYTSLSNENWDPRAKKEDYERILRKPERNKPKLFPTTAARAELPEPSYRSRPGLAKTLFKNKIPYIGYTPYKSDTDMFGNTNIWLASTWKLKTNLDQDNCVGLDHLSFHFYPDNESRASQKTASAFEAWLKDVGDWMPILRRQHALLQHGHNGAEIAYLTEIAPKHPEDIWSDVYSQSHSYYYISPEQILRELYVKDGFLMLGDGSKFRVLVIPPGSPLSLPLLKKIEDLAHKGGVFYGPNPLDDLNFARMVHLNNEGKIKSAIDRLWQKNKGVQLLETPLGRGRVINSDSRFWGNMNISPRPIIGGAISNELDFGLITPSAAAYKNRRSFSGSGIKWAHRSSPDGEIFFLANPLDEPVVVFTSFEIGTGKPELWDPVTGERRFLANYLQDNAITRIPLFFNPKESYFIVFGKMPAQKRGPVSSDLQADFPAPRYTKEYLEQWRIFVYDKKQTEYYYNFYEIKHSEDDASKIYSNSPFRYKSNFRLLKKSMPATPEQRLWLNLGAVHGFAKARLNGRNLGMSWHAPWSIDITSAVCEGENTIDIDIINPWYYRANSRGSFFNAISSSSVLGNNFKFLGDEKELTQFELNSWGEYLWNLLGPVTLQSNYNFK